MSAPMQNAEITAPNRLAERDARPAFSAGLTEEEIGEALGVSPRTARRGWKVAKAWLRAELSSVKTDDSGPTAARQRDHR